MITVPTPESQEAMQAKTQAVPPVERSGGTSHGIPTGGTKGQVLAKESSEDYDADWITPEEKFAQTPVPYFHFTVDSLTLPTDDTPLTITEGISTTCENYVVNGVDTIEFLKSYAASEQPTGVQIPATGSLQETVPSNPAVGLFNCVTGYVDFNPFFGLTFNSVMLPANSDNTLYKLSAVVLKSEDIFTCTRITVQKIKTGTAASRVIDIPKITINYNDPDSTPFVWPTSANFAFTSMSAAGLSIVGILGSFDDAEALDTDSHHFMWCDFTLQEITTGSGSPIYATKYAPARLTREASFFPGSPDNYHIRGFGYNSGVASTLYPGHGMYSFDIVMVKDETQTSGWRLTTVNIEPVAST